ncbi:MAG: transposase [Candidatus Bathyarchaeia archaeon]
MNRLIPKLPSAYYSWIRRRILTLNLRGSLRGSSGPMVIAVDSSGVSVHRSSGWVTRVHDKKKRYVKIHLAVDVKTKEVLAMEVTTDDVHDLEALPTLIKDASKLKRVSKAHKLLKRMGVKTVIKPGRNAEADRGPPERRRADRLIRRMDDEEWTRIVSYGRRWTVKTESSTLKRIFGDYYTAKELPNIAKELEIKAFIHNYKPININPALKTKRQTRNNN